MTKQSRKNLELSLYNLYLSRKIAPPDTIATMTDINLVYRIQFLMIKWGEEAFDQGEIDSLIYW